MKRLTYLLVFFGTFAFGYFYLYEAAGVKAGGVIPKKATVEQLLKLIQVKGKGSFLVPVWQGEEVVSSKAAPRIAAKDMKTRVIMKVDKKLIQFLIDSKRVRATDRKKAEKVFGYFKLNGVKYYLNDPFPGIDKGKIGRREIYPAGDIMKKFK